MQYKEMEKMEALFGDIFQFYGYTHGVQDSWITFTDNAEVCTFKPLYLSSSHKRDRATVLKKARVVSDYIAGSSPYALCIRNFWIEPLNCRIRTDDITWMFRSGGPFDCGSNAGICGCTNGGLLALIEIIEQGLVENEMGYGESPSLQMMEAQAAENQGSVEPRFRELYDRVSRVSEQVHTDLICWECLGD
jgi:hypothetical protein